MKLPTSITYFDGWSDNMIAEQSLMVYDAIEEWNAVSTRLPSNWDIACKLGHNLDVVSASLAYLEDIGLVRFYPDVDSRGMGWDTIYAEGVHHGVTF